MWKGSRAAVVLTIVLTGSAALFFGPARPASRHPLADLAAAVGSGYSFHGRLTGGFVPAAGPTVLRSEFDAPSALRPDTRIAIAHLEKRAAADDTPTNQAALGVAFLVQGEVDRAISILHEAAQSSDDPGAWNDLSAAYLAKADRAPVRRLEYLARALESSATSLRRQASSEARFNRALALQGLAPYVGDSKPWSELLASEADASWRTVAKRYAAEPPPINDARDRWDIQRRELRSRLEQADVTFAEATARQFPEACIEFIEQDLIPAWARATVAKDRVAAGASLRQAELLAQAIGSVTGDRMLLNEIALLQRGHPSLADAHLDYTAGVQAYDTDQYESAKRHFERARHSFATGQSEYVHWSALQLATLHYQERLLENADLALAPVESLALRKGYSTLLGRALWLRGLVYSKQWRLTEALVAFRSAAERFETANQRENAVSLHHHLADTLRTLGEQQESWEQVGKTLAGMSTVRKPVRRYLFLYNASLFASSVGMDEAALLFQDATVREASRAMPGVEVEAFTQRAVIHARRGDALEAEADLNAALRRLGDVPDGALKRYFEADIDVLRASAGRSDIEAQDRLLRAIAFFEAAEPARVPGLYLRLARARRRADAEASASEALERGISTLEAQQSQLRSEALKISYFAEARDLFHEMISLQLETAGPEKAFEFADRARARVLLAAVGAPQASVPLRLQDVQAALPGSVALLYYVVLPDRVASWAITKSAQRYFEVRMGRSELIGHVERFRRLVGDPLRVGSRGSALYAALIEPARGLLKDDMTIAITADGVLQQLPFAALQNPGTGRHLIEDHAIVMTPSARFVSLGRSRLTQLGRKETISALLIGDPRGSTLPASTIALPGARAEVEASARFYPQHTLLTAAAATKEQFLEAAPRFDVVHFGGHAFANQEFPFLSRLSFAGAPLFAYEIAPLRFDRTRVVVLAACSTAVGAISHGEGVVSLARPFLSAGVPTVIASQWDVDDRATRALFTAFHESLAGSQDPVQSLRVAQLSLLRSGDVSLAAPLNWAAFVALGATQQ